MCVGALCSLRSHPLSRQFKELNPESSASYQVDAFGVLKSMFFYLNDVAKIISEAGFSSLAVDGTHSRHVFYRHNGLALFLIGRTSNNKLLTLAFMICEKENAVNYKLFASKCRAAGLGDLLKSRDSFGGEKVGCRGDRDKG